MTPALCPRYWNNQLLLLLPVDALSRTCSIAVDHSSPVSQTCSFSNSYFGAKLSSLCESEGLQKMHVSEAHQMGSSSPNLWQTRIILTVWTQGLLDTHPQIWADFKACGTALRARLKGERITIITILPKTAFWTSMLLKEILGRVEKGTEGKRKKMRGID